MNKRYLKFFFPVFLISLTYCHEETNEKVEISCEADSGRQQDLHIQKTMTISKEGMQDTISVSLYQSQPGSPISYSLYYPSELEMNEVDQNTIQFKRNEALLQLYFFPDTVDSKKVAMGLARKKIEVHGEVMKNENAYRLKPNAKTTATIEVEEYNDHYYYWYANYPVEYGDGFGAEIHFIKNNLEWDGDETLIDHKGFRKDGRND